jgi:putative addiction module killer protein
VELRPRKLLLYQTEGGDSPFEDWLNSLKDHKARAIIRTRLDRVSLGMLGDHHDVGDGVWELRVDFGPGYRVYYGEWKGFTILLLSGGTKRGQSRDIRLAKKYFENFRSRNNEGR